MLDKIRCAFGRHQPDRKKTWNDNRNFRSICRGCGRPMIRDFHGWRPADAPTAPPTSERSFIG